MMESGVLLKRYQIVDQIGSGGMGVIYRAFDRLAGEQVALKMINPSAATFTGPGAGNLVTFQLSLTREFRTLASIRHPNIVSVRDYGFDQNRQPYFTMDLLEGAVDIFEAARGKTLPEKLHYLYQLLLALAYMHRQGILHRDLKPGNVLVVDGTVKVLDFGLSLISEHSVADISQNTAGTISYMAPELLQGDPPSRTSDLYAVGMMGFEILTESFPFDRKNIGLLINQVLAGFVDWNDHPVDEAVKTVFNRLLAKNRSERYPNAIETLGALAAASALFFFFAMSFLLFCAGQYN